MSIPIIPLAASIATLALMTRHLLLLLHHHIFKPQAPNSNTHSSPSPSPSTLPNEEHWRAFRHPEQARTIQAIDIAIEEAKFRRWGEEQGWSECRMRRERAEFREMLLGKVGWGL